MTSSELRTQSKSSAARHAIPESLALTSTARKCGTSSRMLRGWKWSDAGTAKKQNMTQYFGSTGVRGERLTQMDIALMGNGRTVTMQKGLYKRSGLEGLFTDFKHHARSWRNSKKMRAKRERQWLKKLREDGDND